MKLKKEVEFTQPVLFVFVGSVGVVYAPWCSVSVALVNVR